MTEITPQEVLHYGEKWAADLINGLRRDVHAYADKVERLRTALEKMRGWEDWRKAGGGYSAAFRGVMADIDATLKGGEEGGEAPPGLALYDRFSEAYRK